MAKLLEWTGQDTRHISILRVSLYILFNCNKYLESKILRQRAGLDFNLNPLEAARDIKKKKKKNDLIPT